MSLSKKNFLFVLLFFYVLFTFTLRSIHLEQDLFNLVASTVIIFSNIGFLEKEVDFFNRKLVVSVLLLGLIAMLSILMPIIYGTYDLSFFRVNVFSAVQSFLKFLALLVLFMRAYKDDATIERMSWLYIGACCLYFLCTLIFMTFEPLKTFWVNSLYISELDIVQMSKSQYATRVGIDGFAGFGQTFKFAIGIMLSVYLLTKSHLMKRKGVFALIGALLVMLLGTLFYGRIGSVAGILAVVVLVFYLFSRPDTLNIGFSFIFMAIGLVVFVIVASFFNESIQVWLTWAFELFVNFAQTGEFSSASTDILFERMYFIPDLKSVLFGNALFSTPGGGYFMGTDVGFLRSILFFGIVPTIIVYTIIGIIFQGMKEYISFDGKSGSILIALLVTTFLVFEFKGGIYHVMYPMLIPFFGVLSAQAKKER